ncbi:class I SAM-dependent methyltransferase [Nocardiopsis algeriensis]|uniref:SAM-dependent methyltransferase n=1 Tax=Nocardiopsis algeriensis TaxID=1478215 RepID=A0A841IMN7_9ACTN|nr:class I SAM-dependent methyltransferase [Nocardiopsis algeriensis]MBB6119997.1 SAM-dependent methyltransferase [Nocardiopsis algeriensis]
MTATDYDAFALSYSADNDVNLLNNYYERPAMLELAGDVDGHRILDVGCGSGPLSAELSGRGALMTGIDSSARMIELARKRLGDDADLHVLDISGKLPFPDGRFDDAVASLVLHYLEDWEGPLRELHRVLRPGGRLILSVNHPAAYKLANPGADYFATTQWSTQHIFQQQEAVLRTWHRPLHAMVEAFTEAGFRITRIDEPPVAAHTPRELLPPHLNGRTRFIGFLFFVLSTR